MFLQLFPNSLKYFSTKYASKNALGSSMLFLGSDLIYVLTALSSLRKTTLFNNFSGL